MFDLVNIVLFFEHQRYLEIKKQQRQVRVVEHGFGVLEEQK